MTDRIDITEALIDTVGTPIIAFTALALIAEQVESLGDFRDDQLSGARAWPAEVRANMLDDVRDRLLTIKRFAEETLDVVNAEIAAEIP